MKKIIMIALLGLLSANTYAATTANTTKSTAAITNSCRMFANNVLFGPYNPSADSFATSTISLQCTKGTSATVGINVSNDTPAATKFNKYAVWEGQWYTRSMIKGSDRLEYHLFQDANHTLVFGGFDFYASTANSTPIVTGNGLLQTVTVYGALAGGQFVPPGIYSENLNVQVRF